MPLLRAGWVPLNAGGAQLQQPHSQHQQEAEHAKSSLGPAVFHLGNFCEAATLAITCEPLKALPDEAASPAAAAALSPTWGHDYTLCGTCAAVLCSVLQGARIYARHSAHDAAWPFCWRERERVCGVYTLASQLRSSNIIKKGIKSSREIAFLHLDCIRIF